MLSVLGTRAYRHLFAAQVIALIGIALRRSGLAGLPADLHTTVGIGGVHADVSNPRRASG